MAKRGGVLIDEAVTKIVASLAGLLGSGWFLRHMMMRWNSRMRVMGARDAAEVDVIAVLRSENESLRAGIDKAYTERNAALEREAATMSQMGSLRTEVGHLQATVGRLEKEIATLSRRVLNR